MNVALGKKVLEAQVKRPAILTNGETVEYDGKNGFCYFPWPGTCTVDLETVQSLVSIRLLLWDDQGKGGTEPTTRRYRYRLLSSADHQTWLVHYITDESGTIGWQEFIFATNVKARYIQVDGLYNTANKYIHLVELEAHTAPAQLLPRPPQLRITLGLTHGSVEVGGTYRAAAKAANVVSQLRDLAAKNTVLNPLPLLQAADELDEMLSDIAQIEERIDAVNRRIVAPVAKELEFGRFAGKFSVAGFWIGLIGIVVSVALFAISIWLQE